MIKIRIYSLGYKGYKVIETLNSIYGNELFENIIIGQDKGIVNDYSEQLCQFCHINRINHVIKKDYKHDDISIYSLVIGWRWLINTNNNNLIILHDSILPKYRGFNPLVTALINGDDEIGVTALLASKNFDKGNIIEISKRNIRYPMKIEDAIELIATNYINLAVSIVKKLEAGKVITAVPQSEDLATYSLWRDEQDYHIDWNQENKKIRRFVDAVGSPYKGAYSIVDGEKIRILEVEEINDISISNRTPGKVIFYEEGCPVVVCGRGLIKIKRMIHDANKSDYSLSKFRVRFE